MFYSYFSLHFFDFHWHNFSPHIDKQQQQFLQVNNRPEEILNKPEMCVKQDLAFTASTKKNSLWNRIMCLTDPEILTDVEQWKKRLANYSAQVVGKTSVFLNGETEECRFRECNLGNLICDAMVCIYLWKCFMDQ